MTSPTVFQTHGYKLLANLLTCQAIEELFTHALTVARDAHVASADSQVPGTPAVYADPRMELLLAQLIPVVEAETKVSVYPTYSYFRIYKKGDVLEKHKDREACEISLSLCLGYDPDAPWPFWVDSGSAPTQFLMRRGDAVLYKGTEVTHWREEFCGNYIAQVFLHYVNQKGPFQGWKYDKRESGLNLSLPPAPSIAAADFSVESPIGSFALDLKLESLAYLRRQSKCSLVTSSTRRLDGWLEDSPSDGEEWLVRRAQDGDVYAMERLGERLLRGEGVQKSTEQGLAWLKKSAELNNPFAMAKLAEHQLNDEPGSLWAADGERWLRCAAKHGHLGALVDLASRLIAGIGLEPNPEEGERLLHDAARLGSQLAMIKLGIFLLSGFGLECDRDKGLYWLRRAGVSSPDNLLDVGLSLYQMSLNATPRAARRLAREAGILFREAFRQGNLIAGLNLGYILRRGEITEEGWPTLDEVLSELVAGKDSFALVNQALRLARGIQSEVDWENADTVIGRMQDVGGVFDWWFQRSREGDPEGHLVMGWLSRHQLAADPEGLLPKERMDLARKGGWVVPEWLNYPIVSEYSSQ